LISESGKEKQNEKSNLPLNQIIKVSCRIQIEKKEAQRTEENVFVAKIGFPLKELFVLPGPLRDCAYLWASR
jgi:hypothetical protein